MSMNVNSVSSQPVYNRQGSNISKKNEAKNSETEKASQGVVYEKGTVAEKKVTYSINKMNSSRRAENVHQFV